MHLKIRVLNDKNITYIFIETRIKTHLNYIYKAVRNNTFFFCENP